MDNKNEIVLSKEQLCRLQLEELDILKEVARICDKYQIPYFLVGGTMLGAVRHKGFIPWDDDVDIGMLRKNYVKFCKVCPKELDSNKFFFQTWDTDKNYRCQYGRMRKNNTLYVRSGHENARHHNGINIDIFPFDRLPKNKILCIICKTGCEVFRKTLYSPVGAIRENNPFRKEIYRLLSMVDRDTVVSGFKEWIRFFGQFKSESVESFGNLFRLNFKEKSEMGWNNYLEYYFGVKTRTFKSLVEYPFEGFVFKGVSDYDYYLKTLYGNYMKLPPESKRTGEHKAVCIEFSNDKL